jgi:hypothetical protein
MDIPKGLIFAEQFIWRKGFPYLLMSFNCFGNLRKMSGLYNTGRFYGRYEMSNVF